ncbi:uncharacterized protein LOC144877825 isoform X2 [Branchiostoma floridae x Branchiostoma japonicum]
MAVRSVLLLLVVLASTPLGIKGQTCPDGYSYNAGLCYRWTETLTSALDANNDCASDGATLALPRSQDEHDYLTGLISETVLIGITDVLHEGTWKYSDGTEIGAFNKFLPEADYPNTGTIDCVVMSKDDSYMWKPSSCSQEQYGYVCQKDAVIPPPPLVCPDGYSYNAGLCYRWTQTLTSALDANNDCASDGATLALPRSQDEHDYLTGLISETVLIGITDVLHEGTWKYSDGTEIGAFNKFLPEADYPNTGTIDCVVMSKDDSYMWKPSSCSQEQYGYVCQKDADMTKLPQLECPTGYTGVEGTKCYRVVPEPDSAITALAECQAEGADAVLPTSDLEHYYLKSLGLGTHWIGVSDAEPRSTEGNWVYLTTGLPPLGSFNRWGSTANTDDLDCVAMDSTEAYQWAPTYCLDDLACVCQKAPPDQCPPLLAPANGAVSGSSLPEGVATFTCDEGYNLDGASTTTCQADLSWSDDNPTCNIVQCPLITVQAPVILSSGGSPYSYQDEVTFSCAEGYSLDGAASVTCQASGTWSDVVPTCNDIDGCAGDPCDANAACADVAAPGTGQDCTCNTGYEGDGYTCTDIDGCTGDPCDANAACADVAAPGTGQDCTCNTGYEGDGYTCTDIDGCTGDPCDANAACADVAAPGTGQDCTCNTGYEGDGYTCTDIDGCAGDPCDANAACADVAAPGTGQDCTCNVGYEGDGYTCTDIDGCTGDPCDANAACADVAAPGTGQDCTCNTGYEGDGYTCTDIDGCDPNPCDANAACADVAAPGTGQDCTCNAGYEGDGYIICTDIDGCAGDPCDANAACADVAAPGTGQDCTCNTGYEGDGYTCTDIDGCTGDPCDANAACADVAAPGTGQDCTCNTGYEGDGYTCTDIDGCTGDPCDANAACADVAAPGTGQDCTCNTGYEGDGYTCADIDGCAGDPCDANAACADVAAPGTGQDCTCNTGYEGDGYTCTDIDGCAGDPCDANAACADVAAPGTGQDCTCNTGYEGDGYTCTDIDGCAGDPCDANAACADVAAPGTGQDCTCNTGYTGDGYTCTADSGSECDPNPCLYGGTCLELSPSGYSCQCRSGYIGDNCQIGCNIQHPNFPADRFAIDSENRCYWFSRYSDKAKQASAETSCINGGGKLVRVRTAAKQQFLVANIAKFGLRTYWIGLDDKGKGREKKFRWSDGTNYDTISGYHNWRFGSFPRKHKYRDCVAISRVRSEWVVLHCKKAGHPYICEMDTTLPNP